MKAVVFYSSQDSRGKHDSSGAFHPEARAFCNRHQISISRLIGVDCVDQTPIKRRGQVLSALKSASDLDLIAFFCHGWETGFQMGFSTINIPALARAITKSRSKDRPLKVVLYACSTADNREDGCDFLNPGPGTDGGYADLLRDEIARQSGGVSRAGGFVFAHLNAGHCTKNPYVVYFDLSAEGTGGQFVVSPIVDEWKGWKTALQGDWRFLFPAFQPDTVRHMIKANCLG